MKFFLIAVDGASSLQKDAFSLLIQRMNHPWWHWMTDVWFVRDEDGTTTTTWWRDTASSSMPGASVIAIEMPTMEWSVFGPKDAGEWLEQFWPTRDEVSAARDVAIAAGARRRALETAFADLAAPPLERPVSPRPQPARDPNKK